MKRTKKILSVLLCLCLLFGASSAAFAATDDVLQENYSAADGWNPFANLKVDAAQSRSQQFLAKLKQVFAKMINLLSNFTINGLLGKGLVTVIPGARSVQSYERFDLDAYGNFCPGHETFLSAPAEGAGWRLGYGSASIMPADFGEKAYAKGAYLPYIFGNEMYRDDDGMAEELRVRTVVIDDGSGRGAAAFCSVDCMGLANADVRLIRAALADVAAAYNIVSLNVSATHIHTGIDSQGVWTRPLQNAAHNMLKLDVRYGVDRTFLQAVIDGTKKSVETAAASMTAGRLLYSSVNIGDYVWDRTAPICLDDTLYKLEFVPGDGSAPTIIATFGCHPESSSYDWDQAVDENGKKGFDKKFSADFIWYMEKVINAAGSNFIFIQGNVGTVTSGRGLSNDGDLDFDAHESAVRYGYEMGYITLTLNMTGEERVRVNAATGDRLGIDKYAADHPGYTKWYDGLPTVEAVEVAPVLNVAHRQFACPIDNNVIAVIGKTAVADNLVLRSYLGQYYTVTEVGYMELGDALKVYISPGETFTELLKGGSGIAGFPYKPIREVLGENTIIFDLMNDAAGYVANDANYVMAGLQYNELNGELDSDTWCLISYGRRAGSTFIGNLYTLAAEKTR